MTQTQIGAQMYTLREHCKTPADIAKTCQRLSQMGYRAVQASALGPIEPKELAKIFSDNGLTCAATHVSMDMMRDVAKCADYHHTLGCKLPAIGGWKAQGAQTKAAYVEFCKDYSAIAKGLAKEGLTIGYHNHSRELAKLEDANENILDCLIDNTDPSVWFEVDTYWIAHGGGDPALWLSKVAGRATAIHVKDMMVDHQQVQKMCEVGSGNLNWPAILAASKVAGVQWYLVERDNGDLDPFESLKISLDNLKAMGLS